MTFQYAKTIRKQLRELVGLAHERGIEQGIGTESSSLRTNGKKLS